MNDRIKTILEDIKSGKIKHLYDVEFSVEELLSKDSDGIPFLEHVFNNKLDLDYELEFEIRNNIEIAYLYSKNKQSLYFFELSEKDLYSEINGQTYIEYFMDNNDLSIQMVSAIKNHIEIIDMLIKKNEHSRLSYLSPEIIKKLLTKNSDGTYFIEKYFNNKKTINNLVPLINDPNILIELSSKYNNQDLLKNVNERVLMWKTDDGNTFLNYLLNEKNIIPYKLKAIPSDIEFVKFLIDNNLYEYLIKAPENVLTLNLSENQTVLEYLIDTDHVDNLRMNVWKEKTLNILNKNNKLEKITNLSESLSLKPAKEVLESSEQLGDITLLEYMLDKGYNPLVDARLILNEKIIALLYAKKRPDLLANSSPEKLFNKATNHNTYFEYILECVKNNMVRINIKKLFPYNTNINTITNYYFSIVNYDMLKYIDKLTVDDLLEKYDGITLLEALLDFNSDLTLNKILSSNVKSEPKIAIILKTKGFEQQRINVSPTQKKFTDEYLIGVQNTLGIGPLLEEGEVLLNELQQLFLSDGNSDKELITALISGYRQALMVNYKQTIDEIKNLISVKEENKDKFFYIKTDKDAYFSPSKGSVFCDSLVVDTLLHETGHALHHYLCNGKNIENYNEVIARIRNNTETLKKVEDYSKKYNRICKEILSLVKEKYKIFFELYYSEDKKDEIKRFLRKTKQEKKEEFIQLEIPEEQLEIILNQMFTEEEYIEHQKRIFINENTDAVLGSDFGGLMAIGDILDAIYEGKLHSGELRNSQGEKIKGTAGHGIAYYFATKNGFNEMIANFASICKSKDSVEMLKLLRNIIGNELYNELSGFYYHNMSTLKEKELDLNKGRGGK